MRSVVLDLEYSMPVNNHRNASRFVGVGWFEMDGGSEPTFYPIDHREQVDPGRLDWLRQELWAFKGRIIGQNLSSDFQVLEAHGIRPGPGVKIEDTLPGIKDININETRADLKTWATYLGYPPYWHRFEAAMDAEGVENMPLADLTEYNRYDLCATADWWLWQRDRIKGRATYDLECEVTPLVARMMHHGLKVDGRRLTEHNHALLTEAEACEAKLRKAYGEVNLDSHPQVARLLYDTIGLEPVDGRSTREEVLKKLDHWVPATLLKRRKCYKQISAYLAPFLAVQDHRCIVRGDFFIHGTESGRFTCRKPPLQTIPERLRDLFVPQYDYFLWLDLSQIEFRIAMDLAGEWDVIRQIKKGLDVHAATARQLFGTVTDETRKLAKTINFLILYGGGAGLLAKRAGTTYTKALRYLDDFTKAFPRLAAWIDDIHRKVEEGEPVVSPFGRSRSFNLDFRYADEAQVAKAKREAVNGIPQGMGHDVLLTVWAELERRLRGLDGYGYANEVHDELLVDVTAKSLDTVKSACQDVLADVNGLVAERFGYEFRVPLTGAVQVGTRWK